MYLTCLKGTSYTCNSDHKDNRPKNIGFTLIGHLGQILVMGSLATCTSCTYIYLCASVRHCRCMFMYMYNPCSNVSLQSSAIQSRKGTCTSRCANEEPPFLLKHVIRITFQVSYTYFLHIQVPLNFNSTCTVIKLW